MSRLTEARERVAALRSQLADAEAKLAVAREDADAVRPSAFDDAESYRKARGRALRAVADREVDVDFLADRLKTAEAELAPLAKAEAEADYARARSRLDAAQAALPAQLARAPELLAPIRDALLALGTEYRALLRAADALKQTGARVPYLAAGDLHLAIEASRFPADADLATLVKAITDAQAWLDGAAERERVAKENEAERLHRAREEKLRRARSGEFGEAGIRWAAADDKLALFEMNGRRAGGLANIPTREQVDALERALDLAQLYPATGTGAATGGLPKIVDEVRRYREAANRGEGA